MALRTNIGSLERRLKRISGKLSDFIVDVQRQVSTAIGQDLVPKTPVDTGLARGNWLPGINAPALGPVTFLDKSAIGSPSRIAAAARLLRLGDTFFISSSLSYIELLNQGSSPQEPAGFIQRAVRSGKATGVQVAVGNFNARR